MQESIWQLAFQSLIGDKPYVLLNETQRFDSGVDHIGWPFVAIVFPLGCD